MKTKNDNLAARRARHHAALAALAEKCGASKPVDGLKLWRKLRRIEAKASAAATAQCNAAPYGGQPYLPDHLPDGSEGTEENPTPWEIFSEGIREEVKRAFGGTLPDGFRFNQDPRGYALKIRGPEAGRPGAFLPDGMETDWGGNGLLAPSID